MLALQHDLHRLRMSDHITDTVLLLEHEPVVTLGRGAKDEHVLQPAEELAAAGIDLVATGRGGEVTLHAPGQLVVYPILNLAPDRCDVRRYVKDLTLTMQGVAATLGVQSGMVDEHIGLWVDAESPGQWQGAEHAGRLAKLGAVGVRLSRWVSQHGFAFNLSVDLELYRLIVPCGIQTWGVTSILDLTGRCPSPAEVAPLAFELLCQRLDASADGLHRELPSSNLEQYVSG